LKGLKNKDKNILLPKRDDLQGLVAEGNTVEEAVAIAEDLAHHF
jgi:hypothetical protein